jgi:hypothetical protein
MIRESMPSGYDPMGGNRFFLGTHAKRWPADHALLHEIIITILSYEVPHHG